MRIMRERISDCARKSGPFARTKCQDVILEYRAALDEMKKVRLSVELGWERKLGFFGVRFVAHQTD